MNTTTLGTLVAGATLGYIFRDHISGLFKKEKKDMGAIEMGAVHMNPNHMGAIHMNPNHMGAVEYGALRFGQGPLTSSTTPLWGPTNGQPVEYGDGGMYFIGSNTQAMGPRMFPNMSTQPQGTMI